MADHEELKRGGHHDAPDDDDEGESEHYARGGAKHMRQTMDEPEDEDCRAEGGAIRRPRRARGGHAKPHSEHEVHWYNAEGSPTEESVAKGSDGFGRGGRRRRRAGGMAGGAASVARADKPRRGKGGSAPGHTNLARGGAPFSSGAHGSGYESGSKESRGHEGVSVGDQPGPG
jgi:hypothetical protein